MNSCELGQSPYQLPFIPLKRILIGCTVHIVILGIKTCQTAYYHDDCQLIPFIHNIIFPLYVVDLVLL